MIQQLLGVNGKITWN